MSHLRLVNLGAVGKFSIFELKTSSGKHLEDILHALIVSLMCEAIIKTKD